jgi:hypothetical protein
MKMIVNMVNNVYMMPDAKARYVRVQRRNSNTTAIPHKLKLENHSHITRRLPFVSGGTALMQ